MPDKMEHSRVCLRRSSEKVLKGHISINRDLLEFRKKFSEATEARMIRICERARGESNSFGASYTMDSDFNPRQTVT